MFDKVVGCFLALTLVTLVHGDKHDELLANDYEYIPGVGYYAFGTGRNWMDAQDDCMNFNARLAVIDSEEELQAIVSFLGNNTEETYVFGGYTNQLESQYVTNEGIPLRQSAYTKWEAGKPSNSTDRCGGINTKTGELTDLSCTDVMSYICEHQLWTDYTFIKDIGYYKLHTEGKGWADAYSMCESEGAHLLIINSQAEADAVMQIFDEHPTLLPNAASDNMVFIGFRAVFQDLRTKPYEGTLLTIFGTSVSDLGYVKWISNEPHVGNSDYCGTLYRTGAAYEMTVCITKLAFFCERELQVFNRTGGEFV